jgi:hypothetical protein
MTHQLQLSHPRRKATRTEIAADRRLMLRCWVMSVLPPAEIAAILSSPTPPTITELIAAARERAAAFLTCPHCNKPFTLGESR